MTTTESAERSRSPRRTPRAAAGGMTPAAPARRRPARTPEPSGPSGFGTVRGLPSGRFQAFFTVDGHRVTAPGTFPDRDAARAWLDDQASDRRHGRWHDPRRSESVTLEAFARTWMASRPDLAPRTRGMYELSLAKWVLPPIHTPTGPVELGRVRLSDLNVQLLTRWHAAVLVAARESSLAQYTPHSARAPHPVRAWARAEGIDVPSTGRLAPSLLTAWEKAGRPVLPPPAPAGHPPRPGLRSGRNDPWQRPVTAFLRGCGRRAPVCGSCGS